MDWQTILELMSKKDQENVFFIGNLENYGYLAKITAALANGLGGKIIIGIDINNGHLTGFDKDKKELMSIIEEFTSPLPSITISIFSKNNQNIVLLEIEEGDNKPYLVENEIYVVAEKSLVLANSEAIKELKGYESEHEISSRQKKALIYVKENQIITNRDYRRLFDISHKTAHLELTDLVEKNILKTIGAGRSTAYSFIDWEEVLDGDFFNKKMEEAIDNNTEENYSLW